VSDGPEVALNWLFPYPIQPPQENLPDVDSDGEDMTDQNKIMRELREDYLRRKALAEAPADSQFTSVEADSQTNDVHRCERKRKKESKGGREYLVLVKGRDAIIQTATSLSGACG
jgi:uncharacterized membrane protein YkoI